MTKVGRARRAALCISVVACAFAGGDAAHAASFRSGDGVAQAAASLTRTLVGVTSQFPCDGDDVTCGAVNVVMRKGRKSIARVIVGWQAACAQPGISLSGVTVVDRPRLRRAGRRSVFKNSGQLQDDLGDGVTGVADVTVGGTLTRRNSRGSGTFRLIERVYRDGQQIDTCDTGKVHWTAALGGGM